MELELRIPDGQTDQEFWRNSGISRILAVDDNKEICNSIQVLMKDTGVIVDMAFGGQDAISQMKEAWKAENPYHMVLLDWKMPDMDGVATAKRIREEISKQNRHLF